MRILFPLNTLDMTLKDLEQPNARDKIACQLANAIYENTDHNYNCTTKSIIMGVSEPDVIKEIAINWNNSLRTNFYIKLNTLKDRDINFTLDTADTYNLKLAARELDNDWTPYGTVGIILPGEFSFHPLAFNTIMTQTLFDDIDTHPENYIVLTASVFASATYNTTPCYDWND